MYTVSTVTIEGFWDTYRFSVSLDPSVTFFIGQNGTGKTTFINLLAAALTADFPTLDRMPFSRISIALTPKNKDEKPSITVTKSSDKKLPFPLIDYKIVPGGRGAKEVRFSLDDAEEQMFIRRTRHDLRSLEYYRRFQTGLLAVLNDLIHVNWLSIHRSPPRDRTREERTYESTVDQKLDSLSTDLVKYFATLSKQKDDEIRAFQEYIFVSLLEQRNDVDLFENSRLDLVDQYAESLKNIFKELHVQRDTSTLLSDFVSRANHSKSNVSIQEHNRVLKDDLVFRIGLYQIEDVVRRWSELQQRLNDIFRPRERFQSIADELFQRKKMTFTDSDEMRFTSRSGKLLTPQMLSSGEKQLLILMSEALLQRERPAIFIADEPELSLHVLWQERLVGSLRALNANSQIIAATHSPDIVGALVDKVVDMETLIK